SQPLLHRRAPPAAHPGCRSASGRRGGHRACPAAPPPPHRALPVDDRRRHLLPAPLPPPRGAAAARPCPAPPGPHPPASPPRGPAWGPVGLPAVLVAPPGANTPRAPTSGGFVLTPGEIAVALSAGFAIANRRAYVDSVRAKADADARRQIDEERLRIARELHDVVAHTMATINVQASAATQLLRDRPGEAAESLAAIRAASKDGLRELRAILNALRHADEPADPTQPAPSLARLDALAAGVRAAGLPVTVTVTAQPPD